MGLSGRGIGSRAGACAVAALAVLLACAGAATAATVRPLTIGAGVARSCATAHPIAGAGVTSARWRAPADSSMQARLGGGARDDWDLALFDAGSGRRLDASLAWGSDEVVQALVRRGQTVVVQACRLRGASARLPLRIDSTRVKLAAPGVKPPAQKLVQIAISSPLDIAVLSRLGINLNEAPEGNSVSAVLGAGDAARLARAGYTYRTLTPDLAAQQRRYVAADAHAAAAGPSALPSGRNTYRHYSDIQADLKKVVAQHPGLARPITLPKKSFQGRSIQGIEVSARVHANDDGRPAFFLMGEHHAREWPSAEIPDEMALYLARNYGRNTRVTKLLKRVRIFIVPVINPDGYIASREATDVADLSGDPGMAPSLAESVAPPGGSLAYRRKNCDGASPNPATPCGLQYGVDPNRNYGQNWGGPGAGTSPGDQDYRGTGMWSEPETQAVHEFSRDHDITTLVTMHNFASLVLRPPGVHDAGLAPDEDALKKLGDQMARDTGYTSEYSYQLYDTSGTTEDWNYAAAGTYGYTIEMGPSSDKGGNFHIAYDRAVVNQWTGSETEKGNGKGLRDALLAAGEAAADQQQFSTVAGTAPAGEVLRLHKDFTTFSSDICTVEDTGVDCTAQGAVLPKQSQPDHHVYTSVVPPSGNFSWIVTPSTRPFELKAGRSEQWTLTCEDPGTHKVEETRKITVDRGQTLQLDLGCGGVQAATVTPVKGTRACVDKRKLKLQVHSAKRDRPRKIRAFVNGKLVRVLRGSRARSGRLNLENLRSSNGTFEVSVVAYFKHGVRRVSTRTYKGCTKSRPHTKRKKKKHR